MRQLPHKLRLCFGLKGSGLHEPGCIARNLFEAGLTQPVDQVIDGGLIFVEPMQRGVSRGELWIELS